MCRRFIEQFAVKLELSDEMMKNWTPKACKITGFISQTLLGEILTEMAAYDWFTFNGLVTPNDLRAAVKKDGQNLQKSPSEFRFFDTAARAAQGAEAARGRQQNMESVSAQQNESENTKLISSVHTRKICKISVLRDVSSSQIIAKFMPYTFSVKIWPLCLDCGWSELKNKCSSWDSFCFLGQRMTHFQEEYASLHPGHRLSCSLYVTWHRWVCTEAWDTKGYLVHQHELQRGAPQCRYLTTWKWKRAETDTYSLWYLTKTRFRCTATWKRLSQSAVPGALWHHRSAVTSWLYWKTSVSLHWGVVVPKH